MRLLGIVVLYNPVESVYIERIERYVRLVSTLIVYNNTPGIDNNFYIDYFKDKDYRDRLLFWGSGENKGLALPINEAMQYAVSEGYEFLLTMDQDSKWVNFERFTKFIEEYREKDSVIFIPNISNIYQEKWYDSDSGIYKHLIINSGTIYSRNALEKIGLMEPRFFVEGIDTDYGIRANLLGVKIIMDRESIMVQNTEDEVEYGYFLWKKGEKCKYGAKRLYGIGYSVSYMMKKYPEPWKGYLREHAIYYYGWATLRRILLYGDNRILRVYSYIKGFIEGYLKSGKKS